MGKNMEQKNYFHPLELLVALGMVAAISYSTYQTKQYVQEKGWLYSDFIISSFDADRLKRFHDYSPKVKLGLICKKLPTNIRSLIKTIPLYSVHISGVFLTQRQVEALHNNGVKVLVWTVNGTNLVEKFKRWKADGLFSDYPDLLMKN